MTALPRGRRAIEIPFEEIQRIAKALLDGIDRGQSGFLKEGRTNIVQSAVYDVKGKEWLISAKLKTVYQGNTGGKHRDTDPEQGLGEVDVVLNDLGIGIDLGLIRVVSKNGKKELVLRDGPEDLTENERAQMEQARMKILTTILVHEYTHARDVGFPAKYYNPGNFDKATKEQRRRYLNQNVEVRALINQVLAELTPFIESGLGWRELLANSPSWTTMVEPYLSPRKKAKVIDAVQRLLEGK